jgi:hypothetical protein
MRGPDAQRILQRENGRCIRCGEQLGEIRGWDWSIHHRRRRDGKPDSHSLQNCVAMCGGDNVTGCHGWAHQHRSESQPDGYWLSRIAGEDPLLMPILVGKDRWVYLSVDGEYSYEPPEVSSATA